MKKRKWTKFITILSASAILSASFNTTAFASIEGTSKTIDDFMTWVEENKSLSDAAQADIDNAQEMLSEYVDAGYISLSKKNDASNLKNIWHAITVLENIDTLRKSDENYNGSYYTTTPTLSTDFTMLVGSAYTADVSYNTYSHVSNYRTFSSNENLAWGFPDPTEAWYGEKYYFNKAKKALGLSSPLTGDELSSVKSYCYETGWTIGHYTNMFYSKDMMYGVGVCTYNSDICTSGNASSVSKYETNGYETYLISDFKKLFKEYYQSVYGQNEKIEDQIVRVSNLCKTVKASKKTGKTAKKKTFKIKTYAESTITLSQKDVVVKKISGNKKIKVSENGEVTVKKGLKKGTYKVKIKVKVKATAYLKGVSKKKTITVKVK